MGRKSHNRIAWIALAAIIGAGFVPAGDLDSLAQGSTFAVSPPDLCGLLPLLDESVPRVSRFAEPDALATDEGYGVSLAPRAPPEQA